MTVPEVVLRVPQQESVIRFGPITDTTHGFGPKPPTRVALVMDRNVSVGFAENVRNWIRSWGVPAEELPFDAGEDAKSVAGWQLLLDFFHGMGLDRGGGVVTVGGGAVGDVAGFAAATWQRGVPWVGVPTTLLAMVDAFVGGKTGINHQGMKNQVGAFHLPTLVHVDPDGLAGLPPEELTSGWAEVIKTVLIGNPECFGSLESGALVPQGTPELELIAECVRIKSSIVAEDFHDSDRRMALNFGHTLGHAIEQTSGPGNVLHGQSVAVGMVFAALLAQDLGVSSEDLTPRIRSVLERAGLPQSWDPDCSEQLLSFILRDKKNRGGKLRMALLKEVGEIEIVRVPLEIVAQRLRQGTGTS